MTYTAQRHIKDIVAEFERNATAKYLKGQREHKGKLWRKPVIREVMPEALDFVIYLSTLLKQVEIAKKYLREGKNILALNVLEYGNPEGTKEDGD